jgi:putative toxin-antitoxin system antitoxin component (TIGR02293 family)
MSMTLPNEKHRRKAVNKDRTSPKVAVGEPWPDVYVEVARSITGLELGSRTVFLTVGGLLVFGAFAAAGFLARAIFVGEHRGDAFSLLLSVPGAVLSIIASLLAYRSARIATRVERSLAPKVLDLERLRAHETESAILMRALEVFGDSERAIQWMRESNPALNNEPPIGVIQTDDGRRQVLNILGRIQHGVIS